MTRHTVLSSPALKSAIRNGTISMAGNLSLRIYGLLSCRSGKRMKSENRVFFVHEQEAIERGFRPCAHCLREKYVDWLKRKKRVDG